MSRNTHVRAFILFLTLGLSLSLSASFAGNGTRSTAVNYEPLKETVSRLIKKEMKKNDVVGLSIALVDDQQVVWAEGFGFADERNKLPAGPETVYRIGSLTKLFTATAAMQLAEQGALDLDQSLQHYLPEFSVRSRQNGSRPITIRSLLTHHSGLPSNLQKGMWSSQPEPFANVINQLKDEYAAYPPDYIYSYSNIGMDLVGLVIERVSNRDYDAWIQGSLLHPLGMTRTGFAATKSRSGVLSRGYHKGREREDPLLRDVPAGGMQSTVLDLGRFMQMVLNKGTSNEHQVLKPETLAEMLRPQNLQVPLDLGLRTGIGWALSGLGDIDIQNAGAVAHHAGATLLFHSQLIVLPEQKLGVVVLANSSTSFRVVNKAAVQAITLALEAKTGIKQPVQKKPVEVEAPLQQEILQDYAGQYASIAGLAEITPKTDHLHAEVMNRTFQLTPCADGGFNVKYRLLGLFEIKLGELDYYELSRATVSGCEILKARTKGRELLIAEKIHLVPVPEAWQKHAGKYRIMNLGDDFPLIEDIRLRYSDGLLAAEFSVPFFFKGTARFPLKPMSDTEAVISGLGRGMGETIRVVQFEGAEALRYSGYILKRMEK
jgi:CubicO group peptidase (beta-lactamase class C family)